MTNTEMSTLKRLDVECLELLRLSLAEHDGSLARGHESHKADKVRSKQSAPFSNKLDTHH